MMSLKNKNFKVDPDDYENRIGLLPKYMACH